MSSIEPARTATFPVPRARARTLNLAIHARVWQTIVTWSDILSSAMVLSKSLDAAPPTRRAAIAATWIEVLDQRLSR